MLETKIEEVRKQISDWKKQGLKIGLVPTMGALHEGHLSLIKKSVETLDRTIVSVFVNPTQFGPSEDLDKYPRTLDEDLKLCADAGVDLVFAPTAAEMYCEKNSSSLDTPHPNPLPQGEREQSSEPSLLEFSQSGQLAASNPSPLAGEGIFRCEERASEKLGEGLNKQLSNDFLTYVVPPFFYTDKLCAKSRPGHFDGVCTVVTKLFNIVQPDCAFFGQKDAQQLVIIKKMVKDLNIPVEIVSCPIVRGENGLALSSRNKYLSAEGKKEALVLNKILTNIKLCYNKGIKDIQALSETAYSFLNEHHELEYLEFVDKDTLETKNVADDNTMVLTAIRVDNIRLIDNCFIR